MDTTHELPDGAVTPDFSRIHSHGSHCAFRIFRGQLGSIMAIVRSRMTWVACQTARNRSEAVMTNGRTHSSMHANPLCGQPNGRNRAPTRILLAS